MQTVIGLGQAGCSIADHFKQYPQYNIIKLDVGLRKTKHSFGLKPQASPELYEKNMPRGIVKYLQEGVMSQTLFITSCVRYWDSTDQSKDSGSGHWIPQNHFFELDGYQHVDFLGTYENLEDDWKQVAKKIGVSEKLPFVGASNTGKTFNKTREKLSNISWDRYYIDKQIINKVYELYGREIDLLYGEYNKFLKKDIEIV